MEFRLSPYGAASTRPAPVNQMMADFATDFRDGVDINLGVGYVNEATIPSMRILEAMEAVNAHPEIHRQALNYGGPQGSPNLTTSIRRFLTEHRNVPGEILSRKHIIIGANGATSLLEGIADVIAPGIVITSDPMYYIYCNTLERKGFRILAVPEEEEGVAPEAVEAALQSLGSQRDSIAFLYFVTVNNPSCAILSNERRQKLVHLASCLSREQGRIIPLFFDQAYELLVHDPSVPPLDSGLLYDELGVVYELGTLSKILAPALRIGYMIGAPGPFMNAMTQKTSDVGFSAPLITQEIASYLLDRHVMEQLKSVNSGYRRKALEMRQGIDRELGAFLSGCRGGQAGFYFYLTFHSVETHTASAFFRYLTRTTGQANIDGPADNKRPRVIYIPGEYCVHPKGQMLDLGRRQLRLSYGFEETPHIIAALAHMREAAAWSLSPPVIHAFSYTSASLYNARNLHTA